MIVDISYKQGVAGSSPAAPTYLLSLPVRASLQVIRLIGLVVLIFGDRPLWQRAGPRAAGGRILGGSVRGRLLACSSRREGCEL
jgi:hypothetical protein